MTNNNKRLAWYSEDFVNLLNLVDDSKLLMEYKGELNRKLRDLENDGYIKRGN